MDTKALAHRRFDLKGCGTLYTGQLIHQYPGKRALYRGSLNGQSVVAKFYLSPLRTAWEWWRGSKGARTLQRSGIPSPAMRYSGFEAASRTWLTVVDWIEADRSWPPCRNPLSQDDHELLLRTLATHHQAGVVQNDLNWANFIPRDGILYTIDSDRIRQHSAPLSHRRTRNSLRRLYGSKTRFTEEEIRAGWQKYWQIRGQDAGDTRRFVSAVQTHRRHVGERVSRRTLRGWKYYVRERGTRTLLVAQGRRVDPDQRERLRGLSAPSPACDHQNPSLGWPTEPGTFCEGSGRLQYHAGSTLERLHTGNTPKAVWFRAAVARRLRLPVEGPLGFFQVATGPTRRGGYVVFRARAQQGLQQALEEGLVSPEEALSQCRALLSSLAAARMPHPSLALEGLGWGRQRVILLDIRGLHLAARWGKPPRLARDLPLFQELAAQLQQPTREIRRQLVD